MRAEIVISPHQPSAEPTAERLRTLLEARGLTRDDFARYHPAGNLGRVLLLRVKDIMRTGERLPLAHDTVTTQEAILRMTRAKSGSIALVTGRSGNG